MQGSGAAVSVKVKRSTVFSKIITAYCKKKGVEEDSVKLVFDGARVEPESTPEEVRACECLSRDVYCRRRFVALRTGGPKGCIYSRHARAMLRRRGLLDVRTNITPPLLPMQLGLNDNEEITVQQNMTGGCSFCVALQR